MKIWIKIPAIAAVFLLGIIGIVFILNVPEKEIITAVKQDFFEHQFSEDMQEIPEELRKLVLDVRLLDEEKFAFEFGKEHR